MTFISQLVRLIKSDLPPKLAIVAATVLGSAASLTAADFYVAQSALGAGDGSTPANAAGTSFFNTSANWSPAAGAAGKISPGSTVYLLGTISSPLLVQGSGAVGRVITIFFQPSANLTSPAWPNSGAINVGANSYITVDGGANGLIQNTANGDSLANQVDSTGIKATNAANLTVRNLTVANLYVRNAAGGGANPYGTCVSDTSAGGGILTNYTVSNCTLHDAYIGIGSDYGLGCSDYEFSFNTIYDCNWGGTCGDTRAGATVTGLSIHDNHIYNFSNWDQADADFKSFGFYVGAGSGGTINSLAFYNNTIGPNFGAHAGAGLFLSGLGTAGPNLIYDNLFLENSGESPADGLFSIGPGPGSVVGIYNNTFIGGGTGAAIAIGLGNGVVPALDVRNNIVSGTATFYSVGSGGSGALVSDYNDGYNLTSGEVSGYPGGNPATLLTLAQWQALGYEAHSTSANPNLNNTFVPQPISAAIGTGSAVEGNGTTQLSSIFSADISGTSRLQGTGWDMGAFAYAPGSPVLTVQPANVSIAPGGTATFTVAATGAPYPTFEWRRGTAKLIDGGNISGASTSVLTVSSASSNDTSTYSAVASNSVGFSISDGAQLSFAAPVITSSASATATMGSSFTYLITGTNSPTRYGAIGLPPGLSLNAASGLISGAPTTAGPYTVIIGASNAAGTGSASLVITVNGPVLTPPVVTSPASATAILDSTFSYLIAGTNSPTSYGAFGLPARLSLNTASGRISGKPTTVGIFTIVVGATNAAGTGSASLSLTVNGVAPVITSPTSAAGTVGSAFSYLITGTNSPTSYRATGLPAGLSVNTASGLISGTPATGGGFKVAIGASNAAGTGSANLSLVINGTVLAAPVVTSSASATATLGSAFSYFITGTNSPTHYKATGLPAGLTLNAASGLISGTPTAAGAFNLVISASNAAGTGSASLRLTVNGPVLGAPVVTSPANATATLGSAFSYPITATNSPSGYGAFGLPTGLSVNTASGLISGTPTAAGATIVTIGATNAAGTGSASLTLTVNGPMLAAPVITSSTSATATVSSAFSYFIAGTNSPTSYGAFSLPAGLTLNIASGRISGKPTAVGVFTIVVGATNAAGTGSASLTLTVNGIAPVVTSPPSASGTVGSAFSYLITGTHAPTSYSASGLPAGLSLNTASGRISGKPTASGVSSVIVGASNASGTGSATLTLTVASH